jgi:hypothetical protein
MDTSAAARTRAGSRTSFLVLAAVWIAAYIVARFLLKTATFGSGLAVFYALLPIPAFIAFVWAVIAQIRKMDELRRRMHLEALAIAFPLSITLLMVLGLLELATNLPKDDLSYRHVWPLLILFYYAGLAIAGRRYS